MFAEITSMVNLAFEVLPLMLLMVVIGFFFKGMSQFRTGEWFGSDK